MHRFGFTVLEILITITIMSLFIGGAFVGFSSFSKRQKLIAAGETMKNVLRDVQSRATTGEIDCAVCDCSTAGSVPEGWNVDFSSREIYGECQSATYFRKSFDVSSDILIDPRITPPYQMRFLPPPGGAENSGTICLSSSELSGQYYLVKVEPSGNITDSGQLDASCTP